MFANVPGFVVAPVAPGLVRGFNTEGATVNTNVFNNVTCALVFVVNCTPFKDCSNTRECGGCDNNDKITGVICVAVVLAVYNLPGYVVHIYRTILRNSICSCDR